MTTVTLTAEYNDDPAITKHVDRVRYVVEGTDLEGEVSRSRDIWTAWGSGFGVQEFDTVTEAEIYVMTQLKIRANRRALWNAVTAAVDALSES